MPVPTDDASYLANLRQMRANLMQEILTEQTARLAKGISKPTYSLDGRSVSWTEWLTAMRKELENLDVQIQKLEPYEWHVRSYS